MLMKRVCSWCNRSMPPKECENLPHESIEEPVTHSICPECLEKALAEIESVPAQEIKPNE